MKYFKVLLLSFLLHVLSLSQEKFQNGIDAWEPEEELSKFPSTKFSEPSFFSFISSASNNIISYYQTNISINSVSRCPFKISCSHYAQGAIQRHGFLGICKFIDRYFFRENNEAFSHYKLLQTENGVLKLDDTFFLSE
ncbi:MAG: membrane protein insertion efficiency factor YidD [Ignavibacteria bacterium]|nr:membrane protein insertion efficiency factor YidD [Ignavibacteria bacterium]